MSNNHYTDILTPTIIHLVINPARSQTIDVSPELYGTLRHEWHPRGRFGSMHMDYYPLRLICVSSVCKATLLVVYIQPTKRQI